MRHLPHGLLCMGALLLTACGADSTGGSPATNLATTEQAILPDCATDPHHSVNFYSDHTRTTEVGWRGCTCDGEEINLGQATSWYTVSYTPLSCP
ncbi:hypothetical protein HRD49_23825 [Corallococcus exiguus]|uniref:hypothetical protein n=1 Tax=Corallococcus exiguus TaxID=83462 RepID=UPI00155FC80C|nr:hypothetical protein [Corallococcus exiguus]NRD64788.1 hypothetical protein [Corallococcus exiguus]